MKLKRKHAVLAAVALSVLTGTIVMAKKLAEAPESPLCELSQTVGTTHFVIRYSRPSVKGRDVFGALVPYDKVWRTGANKATKVTFDKTVKFNGTQIPAGSYALMTIPGKDSWTVILNKDADQFGAFNYNSADDQARVTVIPSRIEPSLETFTIEFNDLKERSATLNLAWDHVSVPILIHTESVEKTSVK